MHRLIQWAAGASLVALGAVTGASYAARLWWVFELASHFRVQLAALAVALFIVSAILRFSPAVLGAAVLIAINAVPLLPYVAGATSTAVAETASAAKLRVLTLNLHHRHADLDTVQRLLEAERPDVVLFTELPPGDEAQRRFGPMFQHIAGDLHGSTFDVLVLSRWSIEEIRTDRSAMSSLPVTVARLCDGGRRCLRLIGLHAARPLEAHAAWRNAQLRVAAVQAAESDLTILAGDLNLTPWSPVFSDLLSQGRLRDSAVGRGVTATWLSRFALFGLAIDHILVGDGVAVRGRRVGPDVGSDHFPVIADLVLR